MPRAIIAAMLLLLHPPSSVVAAIIDFEDLSSGTTYSVDELFQSGGLTFEPVDTGVPEGRIQVLSGIHSNGFNLAGGTGNAIGFGRLGLNFLLPPGTQQVSMLVGVGSFLRVKVNGIETPITPSGSFPLNGSVTDGVTLSLLPATSGGGVLALDGPISSLLITGSELGIDNVTVIVPEPSTAMLLFAASISLLTPRRRHA